MTQLNHVCCFYILKIPSISLESVFQIIIIKFSSITQDRHAKYIDKYHRYIKTIVINMW